MVTLSGLCLPKTRSVIAKQRLQPAHGGSQRMLGGWPSLSECRGTRLGSLRSRLHSPRPAPISDMLPAIPLVEPAEANLRLRRGARAWAIIGGHGPCSALGLRRILHHQGAPGREQAPNNAISQGEEGPPTRHGPARASVDQGNESIVSHLEPLGMRLWHGIVRDRWYPLADHVVS